MGKNGIEDLAVAPQYLSLNATVVSRATEKEREKAAFSCNTFLFFYGNEMCNGFFFLFLLTIAPEKSHTFFWEHPQLPDRDDRLLIPMLFKSTVDAQFIRLSIFSFFSFCYFYFIMQECYQLFVGFYLMNMDLRYIYL